MEEKLVTNNERRILVVEDDKTWRRELTRYLEQSEIKFAVADSAKAAKKVLEEGGYTDIITDGLEGTFTDVIEAAGTIPVTVLSGDYQVERTAKEMEIRFMNKGAFDPEKLLE